MVDTCLVLWEQTVVLLGLHHCRSPQALGGHHEKVLHHNQSWAKIYGLDDSTLQVKSGPWVKDIPLASGMESNEVCDTPELCRVLMDYLSEVQKKVVCAAQTSLTQMGESSTVSERQC